MPFKYAWYTKEHTEQIVVKYGLAAVWKGREKTVSDLICSVWWARERERDTNLPS